MHSMIAYPGKVKGIKVVYWKALFPIFPTALDMDTKYSILKHKIVINTIHYHSKK